MEITRVFDLLPYYEEKYKPKDDVLAGKVNGVWKKYSIKEFREIVDALQEQMKRNAEDVDGSEETKLPGTRKSVVKLLKMDNDL